MEGNLAQKTEPNGDTWRYEYFGNGMLCKVVRPDNSEVTFKYDPLGRRIEKQMPETTKHFVWDGNNPLHEWTEETELVTWVFDDGFVPTAKLTSDGNYSIVSDYLGTPVEAYDENGDKVWSAELDIYGRVKEFTGDVSFVPFRYQGQYHDSETGLYYNRFRYYDPQTGLYTQQDPIGLEGNNPTLYAYVADTNALIDVFGLKGCSATGDYVDLTGFRRNHILNRHRHGAGYSGKTEFPSSWSDRRILHNISDIATDPKALAGTEKWNSPYVTSIRDGIEIRVVFIRTIILYTLGKFQLRIL